MDENIDLSKNTEINQALKEFEIKSQMEQMKNPSFANGEVKNSDLPKMVQLVMKWFGGAIKEQKQAEYVLIFFVILVIGISLFLVFNTTRSSNKMSSAQKAALDQMLQLHPDLIKK